MRHLRAISFMKINLPFHLKMIPDELLIVLRILTVFLSVFFAVYAARKTPQKLDEWAIALLVNMSTVIAFMNT